MISTMRRHQLIVFSVVCLAVGLSEMLVGGARCARGAEPATADAPANAASEPDASSKKPRPRKRYKGRRIAQTMSYHGAGWLIRSNREQEEDGARMLESLHVTPGQTVVDFGCGNGYHTLKLAQQLGPTGRVLAVDIQPEMLRLLEARLEAEGIKNVEPILAGPYDPALPTAQVDLILMVDVYHELSYPEEILSSLRQSLRPKGRVVLVEFRAEDPLVPIKPEHKMTKKQVLRELLPNGFRLVEEFDDLPWQHVMFFEADGMPQAQSAAEDSESDEADEAP